MWWFFFSFKAFFHINSIRYMNKRSWMYRSKIRSARRSILSSRLMENVARYKSRSLYGLKIHVIYGIAVKMWWR
jgi:hypothetical protein